MAAISLEGKKGMPMELSLSKEEASDLEEALENYLVEKERDLVRTDVRRLQREFHITLDRIQAIHDRLQKILAAVPA